MRTYVTVLAGRTPSEMRPIVSSADPLVIEATLRAIRAQAARETTAGTADRERAQRSVHAAARVLTETPDK